MGRKDFKAPLPPAWVISLARSGERRRYIETHLADRGLAYEIVDAVDGGDLSTEALADAYDSEGARACIRRELAASEIGCGLSHLKLFQRMIDEDIEVALIMEDDAWIRPETLPILQRRDAFPPDWEVVLLQHFHRMGGPVSWWHRHKLLEGYRVGRLVAPTYGTAGYLIKRSAARKLLDASYPLRAPADHWICGHMGLPIRIYGIDPPCIRQCEEIGVGAIASTMPDRDELRSRRRAADEVWLPQGRLARRIHNLKVRWRKRLRRYDPRRVL
jgi:glycosyl transferase family 25